MDPQEYKDLVTFISSNHTKFPTRLSISTQGRNANKSLKNKRSFYRNKVKKFLVRDNTLYRKLNPKSLLGVKVVLKDQVDDILKKYHCNEDGTHNGINRTLEALKRKYWWLGISEDVRHYAKVCEICKAGPNYIRMKKGKKEVQDDSWKVVNTEDEATSLDLNSEQFNTFRFSNRPTLEQIRNIQEKFCAERNWNQFHTPRNLMMALVGEVGELAEIFQWRGEVAQGLPEFTAEEKDHVGEELSDILVYLVRLADKCEIDLPATVLAKIEQNRKKYPVDQSYGKSLKYTAYQTQQQHEEQQCPQQQQQQTMPLPKILKVTGNYSEQQSTVSPPKIMKVAVHNSPQKQQQQQKATVSSPTILKVTAHQSQQLQQIQQQYQKQQQRT